MDSIVQAVVLVLLLPRPSLSELAVVIVLALTAIVLTRDDDHS